jgi:hypothetical protein
MVYQLQLWKKKKKGFFYSLKRQMEDDRRPVARVIVCLSQENIAKLT